MLSKDEQDHSINREAVAKVVQPQVEPYCSRLQLSTLNKERAKVGVNPTKKKIRPLPGE